MKPVLFFLSLIFTATVQAGVSDEQAVLATYEQFIGAVQSGHSAEEIKPLLANESPLALALEQDSASEALVQFREMLNRFSRTDTQVEISGMSAQLTASGKTPVTDPNILKFIQSASVTHRVEMVRTGDAWKILDSDYKVRYSD